MEYNPLSFTLTPGMAPAAPLMRLLASFDRQKVEAFAEISVALLDLIDGDADVELNGDEEDSDGDDRGDQAYVEWHTMRGSQKRGPNIVAGHEDDEDDDPAEEDDPAGQCDEDGINTLGDLAMHALQNAGPGCDLADPGAQCTEDEISTGNPWLGRKGPGCELSDPGGCEHDGREHEQGY